MLPTLLPQLPLKSKKKHTSREFEFCKSLGPVRAGVSSFLDVISTKSFLLEPCLLELFCLSQFLQVVPNLFHLRQVCLKHSLAALLQSVFVLWRFLSCSLFLYKILASFVQPRVCCNVKSSECHGWFAGVVTGVKIS